MRVGRVSSVVHHDARLGQRTSEQLRRQRARVHFELSLRPLFHETDPGHGGTSVLSMTGGFQNGCWQAVSLAVVAALLAATGCEGAIEDPLGTGAAMRSTAGQSDPTENGKSPDAGGDTPQQPPSAPPSAPGQEDCAGVVDVSDAPLRRLTQTEYRHTVADVFGVDSDVSTGLSADERVDGMFASNLASSVAPVQVRQYFDAAEHIAAQVKLTTLYDCATAKLAGEPCATKFIERVGLLAYRRPLSADERAAFLTVYSGVAASEGHEPGLRALVQTFLQSPHLLYHLELQDPSTAKANSIARLPDYALASRLSYFMWSSAPDETLLSAAESGALSSDDGVLAQAERMFADPRAAAAMASFHGQWLGLNKLDAASRDPKLFPDWNPALITAMRDETTRFADYVIRDQRGDLATLLDATYSFPNGPGLALRATTNKPDSEGKLMLDPSQAAGLLTQPAFLAAHSHSNQTSPIIRGRALRERFFCQPLPDPPPTVAAVAPPLAQGLTTRERYALHRTSGSACSSCHSLIDDLGFALEHYDAIGRYRDSEEGKAIDATGQLTHTDVDGPMDGAQALAKRLTDSADAQDCYAKLWFRYALGRVETDRDRCALARVQAELSKDPSIRNMLLAITASDAFLRVRSQ